MVNTVRTEDTATGLSNPLLGMLGLGLAGGLLAGCSFVVVQYWPLPVSVAPYYEDALFPTGFCWGAAIGGLIGLIIGFLTDERHFIDVTYE